MRERERERERTFSSTINEDKAEEAEVTAFKW